MEKEREGGGMSDGPNLHPYSAFVGIRHMQDVPATIVGTDTLDEG